MAAAVSRIEIETNVDPVHGFRRSRVIDHGRDLVVFEISEHDSPDVAAEHREAALRALDRYLARRDGTVETAERSPLRSPSPPVLVSTHKGCAALAATRTPSGNRVRIGILVRGETSVVATLEEARTFHTKLGALLEGDGGI